MTPEQFFSILHSIPELAPATYRLYHDDTGHPLFYSMEDLPGTWIAVDALTYAQAPHDIRVIDGKIQPLPRQTVVTKLRPSEEGAPCHPSDVCLIVPAAQPHVRWRIS